MRSPTFRLKTSARRRPVSTSVRMTALSRRPVGVSGMMASSLLMPSALIPRGGLGEDLGRSIWSQGLAATISIRIRKR